MKTRFDGKLWIGAFGLAHEVKDMETAHLLNTVKMLVQKPARVQAMLVTDIEEATFEEQEAWTPQRLRGGHPQEVPPQRHQPHL